VELHTPAAEKKDYRQDPKAIKEWVEVTYPAIVKRAMAESAEIWWFDETGARNASNYIKGYAPKGVTPTLPVASHHIGVNMISAITNQGKLRYHFYRGNFNQDIYMNFLTRIIRDTGRKAFAIVDNSSTHRGLRVQEWKEKNAALITIFHLPSYAPELNPAEYLNNSFKRVMVKKGYSKNQTEVYKKAMSIMCSIRSTKNRVKSFFDNEYVIYAKAQERL
jgi:transposase